MMKNGGNAPPSPGNGQYSTPDRTQLSGFVSQNPHSELNHKEALEAAKQHHDRVQEAARRTLELYTLGEKHNELLERRKQVEEKGRVEREIQGQQQDLQQAELRRIQAHQEAEKTRIAAEEKNVQETARLEQLKAKKVTAPPPPPQTVASPAPDPKPAVSTPSATAPETVPQVGITPSIANGASPSPLGFQQPAALAAQTPIASAVSASPTLVAQQAAIRRVHQNLKKLRSSMTQLVMENKKTKATPRLDEVNDIRRDIGKWVGQLSVGAGSNKKQLNWIIDALVNSMTIPCPLIDPNDYLLELRGPVDNDDRPQLPSTFIFLLHIFAKKVIKQFAEECGANSKAADPIGVLAVQIFSRPQFLWRGKTLIDILMAKFYVTCPVILGIRGDENTPEGRKAVGWRYQGNGFMPDSQHYMRMTGFGAGFAALALRDFSKSPMEAPLPPWNYWKTFAAIVNTPSNEICTTQLVVLKSMIEGHEGRFLTFYGNVAIAALRAALVDLPNRCPEKNSSVGALQVLGELLVKNTGLPII